MKATVDKLCADPGKNAFMCISKEQKDTKEETTRKCPTGLETCMVIFIERLLLRKNRDLYTATMAFVNKRAKVFVAAECFQLTNSQFYSSLLLVSDIIKFFLVQHFS